MTNTPKNKLCYYGIDCNSFSNKNYDCVFYHSVEEYKHHKLIKPDPIVKKFETYCDRYTNIPRPDIYINDLRDSPDTWGALGKDTKQYPVRKTREQSTHDYYKTEMRKRSNNSGYRYSISPSPVRRNIKSRSRSPPRMRYECPIARNSYGIFSELSDMDIEILLYYNIEIHYIYNMRKYMLNGKIFNDLIEVLNYIKRV
jgi:hypothetical protein